MTSMWRKILRTFHPEGIPGPGSRVYNFLSSSGIFQRHYDLVAEDILRYCPEGRVLDIGTGPRWLLLSLRKIAPGLQLAGLDISPAMIDRAKENLHGKNGCADIELAVGSAARLPFADNSFECVVSTGSMHHWKDMAGGLTEIHRILKKNGHALMYDLVQKLPRDVFEQNRKEFGRYRMTLLWLHSFEEPFYSVREMELLPGSTPFGRGDMHFTGALCCLVMKKS